MTSWQRKRKADAVPTPVAVAVSDYCRRAHSPASAAEVRDALSTLSEEEDFRVRELTDSDPVEEGLGPFALVDIVRGTDAELARQRQTVGYYAVVRELLSVRDQKVIEVEIPMPVAVAVASARSAPTSGKPDKKAAAATMAEKIAPKKRGLSPLPAFADEDVVEEEKQLLPFQERQRTLPKPRGRFSQLTGAKAKFEDLRRSTAKPTLETLIAQHPNRVVLLRSMAESYGGRRGGPLSMMELLDVLEQHQLVTALQRSERDQVVAAVTEHRGALGRVSWALGITPAELESLIKDAGLKKEVEEVRERFRREALSPKNLTLRLDLLGREKYLADLGIKKRFQESLEADLRKLFRESASGGQELSDAVEEVARKHAAPGDLLKRAIEKLGIGPEIEKVLSAESHKQQA
ncbi:MAG: hypothetical protein ACJ790_00065 [Myxococcaceae bacterium]